MFALLNSVDDGLLSYIHTSPKLVLILFFLSVDSFSFQVHFSKCLFFILKILLSVNQQKY